MKKEKIDSFFSEVDGKLGKAAEVILTGAAAGVLMGHVRPSVDIDFEIRIKGKKNPEKDAELDRAIREASMKCNIAVNFSENLGRWSMLDLLDYQDKARLYKKIGHLEIKFMDPAYWTIGKMGRFLEIDIADVETVIKKEKLKWEDLTDLWGRVFQSSPLSLEKGQFRDHVIYFFKRHGKKTWGKDFSAEKVIERFKKGAGFVM